ncbi:MAG: bifunctional phosphopantothenoylcysteine decarboxylase/phosphopantothenate--cysteine ligase CoaBC, partial [Acidimicrobiaceae bacterium]|nr:bifunctional phosphopantothenoylcysteine decarboxylase/phosphopantothenate--cysteine ligase CoaBC [Acidimicrobiaceae bacterium]
MSAVRDRCVVLGVTGGIAAYKAAELCRLLVGDGARVVPVLTESAQRMVGAATFTALASEPAVTSLWDDPPTAIPHTGLGQRAAAVVVAPATARLISDLRNGRSGDVLTATLLATRAPVILAPAMHTEMWEQPSVQDNIATLSERGVIMVGPVEGPLAG